MNIVVDSVLYRSRQLIQEDDALAQGELITAVASYDSNLYVATNLGQLLHYHRFEDSPGFILLSQQKIRSYSVKRVVVVPKSERVVVLCGGTMNLFSLPELSPIQSGKLKDVEDILLFHNNDLLISTKNKLRLVRFVQNEAKLLKDITKISPVKAVGHITNNHVAVANNNEYEIINLQDSTRTPLFLYSTEDGVTPNMIPFMAKDTNKEEILLTIKSDTNASIGMFISSIGEPTRGTFTWIDKGYPEEDVIVQWPYVFGVFNNTLLISSLVTLEVIAEFPFDGKLNYLPNSTSIEDSNYLLRGNSQVSLTSSILFIHENKVSIIYKEKEINIFKENLIKLINLEIDHLSLLSEEKDIFYNQLLYLYCIFKKDYLMISTLSDEEHFKILLYLYSEDQVLLNGIKDVCDILKGKLDEDFKTFALKQIQAKYLETGDLALQLLAYSSFTTDDDFINFSKRDSNSWKSKTPQLQKIIDMLESRNLQLATLQLYILLQDPENITALSTKHLEANQKLDFDFAGLILKNLDKVDSVKIYRDGLLEVLRIEPSKGIAYMKKNISSKHNSTHNDILLQMKQLSNDLGFSQLKLEVLENGYREGSANVDEVLDHLIEMLKTPDEVATTNLSILYQTYLIENQFDSHRDVTTWVDFLLMIKDTSECKEFLEIYLKAYELINYCGMPDKFKDIIDNNTTFDFFSCCFTGENRIQRLLEFKDYCSAEQYAIYGKPPYSQKNYYIKEDTSLVESPKTGLDVIFNQYKSDSNIEAMRHFLNAYGNLYYTPGEIINMLPANVSISHVQEYFIDLFIKLDAKQRNTSLKKILNRQDSSFTKNLYTDLHE